uniref:Putative nucleophosmin-like n=1 Tax=Solanum chacoense TaxID=4108 RepID=A0A0V0HT19_SOLCH
MGKFDKIALLLSLIVITIWFPIVVECAKKAVGVARKEDIPYIRCQVCEKLAYQLYHHVQNKQAEISPKKISEYQIIEISENVCNLKKQEADWILKIDIVEQGDRLELIEQDSEGQCNSECKTIERACQDVMDYSDTDVAEYLYKTKPDLDSLKSFLCKDLTKVCSKAPPPVPKNRVPGEPFVAKSSKEAEMEKLMRSMQGMPGAPGMQMYSREDLMNQKFGDEDADDDDDDDDEGGFPSKLGKVIKEKESKKNDWKQRITKGIQDTSETLKNHANRVSHRMRKWWGTKKAQWKKSSKTGKGEL